MKQMNKQLYLKHPNGYVEKISSYKPGGFSFIIEHRKKWYTISWESEIYEFDPNTLTITTLVPFGPLRK